MFIAFDGMDGIGKSTQVQAVCDYYKRQKKNVIKLDLGGASFFKNYIQRINNKELIASAEIREMLYYFEGLYVNLNVIQKCPLDDVVVIDRYYLSYYAYGLENGLSEEEIKYFTQNLIEPDVYFFLDGNVETTLKRIKKYRKIDCPELGFGYVEKNKDEATEERRFMDFQNKVRQNYYNHITSNHIVIDATKACGDVTKEIIDALERMV